MEPEFYDTGLLIIASNGIMIASNGIRNYKGLRTADPVLVLIR